MTHYQQWENAFNKILPSKQSNELKKITAEYKLFNANPTNPTRKRNLNELYHEWKECEQYSVERYAMGSLAVQGLRKDAEIATMSAYNNTIAIDDDNGAVTMLAYNAPIGGHTHLAFEYIEKAGNYRHHVFHLVALESGCD